MSVFPINVDAAHGVLSAPGGQIADPLDTGLVATCIPPISISQLMHALGKECKGS
jgi:hypothetical protein